MCLDHLLIMKKNLIWLRLEKYLHKTIPFVIASHLSEYNLAKLTSLNELLIGGCDVGFCNFPKMPKELYIITCVLWRSIINDVDELITKDEFGWI